MAHQSAICGIDIGNTAVKVAIASVSSNTQPEIIGAASVPSLAVRSGEIVDIQEIVECIRDAIGQASAMAGVQVKRAFVAANGPHIETRMSRGTIAVARADGEITAGDISRVMQTAQVVSLPPNREILHVIPREFIIDTTERVRDPVGMKGMRLEVDVVIVHGASRPLKNIARCVQDCGVGVAGFVYGPLASSLVALDRHQKEFGVAHLDVGGGTASLTVWDQADLIHAAVMKVGSRHITNDLAILLRTSLENAERIKIELGSVNEAIDRRRKIETIDLTSYMDEPFIATRRQLLHVIDARARELLDLVVDELKKAGKHGQLPAGVILSGGGSKLPGFVSLVRDTLGLPVRQAKPIGVTAFDAAHDPAYSVALGLVAWGFLQDKTERIHSPVFSGGQEAVGSVIRWLKNFLP